LAAPQEGREVADGAGGAELLLGEDGEEQDEVGAHLGEEEGCHRWRELVLHCTAAGCGLRAAPTIKIQFGARLVLHPLSRDKLQGLRLLDGTPAARTGKVRAALRIGGPPLSSGLGRACRLAT